MSDKEKVVNAIERIRKANIKDEIVTAESVYKEMKDCSLFEIAEVMTELFNLICDLRDILEDE